jgi:hypothetical protein
VSEVAGGFPRIATTEGKMPSGQPAGRRRSTEAFGNLVGVQFAQKTQPFVIPKPGLSARNLLAASGETADSSRENAALRTDNCLDFKLYHDPSAGQRPCYWSQRKGTWWVTPAELVCS